MLIRVAVAKWCNAALIEKSGAAALPHKLENVAAMRNQAKFITARILRQTGMKPTTHSR